jgi:predicted enzyme related to lactoylglutathione lyase
MTAVVASRRRVDRFVDHTVQLRVPDLDAGVAFYARLFGRPPDAWPHVDFAEWLVGPHMVLQLAAGEARQAYPIRFRADDLERERQRVGRELGTSCSAPKRVGRLVTFCDFADPWGNRLGFYQPISAGRDAPMPGGSEHDW